MMLVLPQSRPAGAGPSGRIPTVDPAGRGVPLSGLLSTPEQQIRTKFPAVAMAQDHFTRTGFTNFLMRITLEGCESMDFREDIELGPYGASLIKGIAVAFDRFLRESPTHPGGRPHPKSWPPRYALDDLQLTAIITFPGNVLQAEVQLVRQSRAY